MKRGSEMPGGGGGGGGGGEHMLAVPEFWSARGASWGKRGNLL